MRPAEPSQPGSSGEKGDNAHHRAAPVAAAAAAPSSSLSLRLAFSQVNNNSQVNMITASQDLNVALSGCSLNSQQQQQAPGVKAAAAAAAAAAPPPKWGETPRRQLQQQQRIAPPVAPQHYDEPGFDPPLSQLAPQSQIDAYMLGSQDFVTPADQAMENHPGAAHGNGNVLTGSRHARSPAAAAPSPLRGFAKRARGSRLAAAAAAASATPGGAGAGEDSQQPAVGPPPRSSQLSSSQQQQAALVPALLRGSHRRARSPPVATNVFMIPSVAPPRSGSPMSGYGGSGGSGGGGAAAAPLPPPAVSLPSPQSLPVVSRYAAEFRELGPLGAGAFSRVVRAAHRLDGREYAVKKSTQELFSPADVARWRQEAQALAAAGTHRGIVRYYGAWAERGPRGGLLMHVQLERCGASLAARAAVIGGGGALSGGNGSRSSGSSRREASGGGSSSNSVHHALTPLREEELVSAGAQVASALAHLHRRGIAHMDVKPDNIFCALAADGCSVEMLGGGGAGEGERSGGGEERTSGLGDDDDDESFDAGGGSAAAAAARDPDGLDEDSCLDARASGATVAVKLGDFGLATPMRSGGAAALSPDEGDCRYLAPELLEPSSSSSGGSGGGSSSGGSARIDLAAADAFALGASLYELASGAPLPSGGPLWHNLRSGRLALLPATSAPFQRLLRALLHPDPGRRPTMEASLRSGPFAAAMAKIDGVVPVANAAAAIASRKAAAPAAAPAAAAAPSRPKTSMPPPPPRPPLATAKSNVGSAGASRFGALSFKPSTGAEAARESGGGAAGGARLPR